MAIAFSSLLLYLSSSSWNDKDNWEMGNFGLILKFATAQIDGILQNQANIICCMLFFDTCA